MTTTASIAKKGTSKTGITEELAKRCHDQLGRKVLAVVELVAESRSETRSGDESVSLSILTLEPAPDKMTEDHLRELSRSFNYERRLAEGADMPIPGTGDGIEPDLKTVLAGGKRFEPHPFLPVDAADDDGICDVCGEVNGRPQHADRGALGDPFEVSDEAPEPDLDEEEDEEDLEDEEADDEDDTTAEREEELATT